MQQQPGRVMTLPHHQARTPHAVPDLLEISVVEAAAPDRSFDELYRAHRPRIAKALAFSLGDVDLAAEATDEAFVRAYERWAKVQRLDRPEAWVYRVATNWATSVLRRRRRSAHRLYEPAPDAPFFDPAVHESLAALDVKHRSVVVCRYFLGWSVADTAAALSVREGTVKSRLHRALHALHAALHHLDPKEQS
jgi:RNA polymerase sigma-70 factor (ECF subfamily)